MSSIATSPTISTSGFQPWRPWSIPLDISYMRRTVCGLLNKITKVNFDSISTKIVQLAISIENTDDPKLLDAFVRLIFQRGAVDNPRVDVYATLCQRIVDELEGERGRWKRVDLFHLGNPMDCFETCFRLLSQYEFDRIIHEETSETLHSFMIFVGELVVEGVLYPDDVQGMLDTLFRRAVYDEECTVAIYRFLTRIVGAFNASLALEPLMVVARIEELLLEHSISVKARYLMMSMHDQALYPRPHDAFASTQQRIEVYGLDPNDSDFESAVEDDEGVSVSDIYHTCQSRAKQHILNRQVSEAEQFMRSLNPEYRSIFISYLISTTLNCGDTSDASFVASLFSLDSIRHLCDRSTFVKGFSDEVTLLEDTSIDVPQANHLMATMLYGSPLNVDAVEELASKLRSLDVKDRLIDTYSTLDTNSDVDAPKHSLALSGREHTVERLRPSSRRIYAY